MLKPADAIEDALPMLGMLGAGPAPLLLCDSHVGKRWWLGARS